ncbi:nuclear transcription factor Y subunit beta-like protein [Dinothrombium tinctorium]|uniref:Nuclear transcription factor Y subunit beta n=1 Tax=Dinothrombium tinctorium TaxID=1965070 RepID=A0A443R828_9ACAR|nr:nuclear transcription factor Y subunit beta-like protein [Dinothrombium tinctorium]
MRVEMCSNRIQLSTALKAGVFHETSKRLKRSQAVNGPKMSVRKMESGVEANRNSNSALSEFNATTHSSYIVHAEDSMGGTNTENEQSDGGHKDSIEPLREQDRFLPIANVARIMKNAIPKSGKIAKDAKECVQECVSEFVSFITSEASDRCHQEKRKTINGEDILFAMSTLGFDNYVEPLKLYLQKYREAMKGDKSSQNPVDGTVEELSEDSFNAQSLNATISLDDNNSNPSNVVYTTTYNQQVFKIN